MLSTASSCLFHFFSGKNAEITEQKTEARRVGGVPKPYASHFLGRLLKPDHNLYQEIVLLTLVLVSGYQGEIAVRLRCLQSWEVLRDKQIRLLGVRTHSLLLDVTTLLFSLSLSECM